MALILAIVVIAVAVKIIGSLPANFEGSVTYWFVIIGAFVVWVGLCSLFS